MHKSFAFLLFSGTALGGSSNHGGDEVRLLFEEARSVARAMAADFTSAPADIQVKPAVVSWIEQNAAALAADIQATSHLWPDQNDNVTCARTGNTPSPIVFSFIVCRDIDEFTSKSRAARLLVHESVHHFGVTDESFADQVAVVLAAAYVRSVPSVLKVFGGRKFDSPVYAYQPAEDEIESGERSSRIIAIGDSIYSHGLILDPVTDTWRNMAMVPSELTRGTPHWNGKEVIAAEDQTVFRYDPAVDKWSKRKDPAAPRMMYGYTAVASPEALYVFGGYHMSSGERIYEMRGFRYDLASETWHLLATPNSPGKGVNMKSFWTGNTGDAATASRVVVYDTANGRGFIYDPSSDAWSVIAQSGAPSRRTGATTNLIGNELIVWGGKDAGGVLGDGAIYNLSDNVWRPMAKGPTARRLHTATAAPGKQLLVWGGTADMSPMNSSLGYIYDIESDVWSYMTVEEYDVKRRDRHEAVWANGSLWLFGGSTGMATGEVLTPK